MRRFYQRRKAVIPHEARLAASPSRFLRGEPLRRKACELPIRPPDLNPQPSPSRYTPPQILRAPNPQSKSRSYSSPSSPPTASAAHHSPLHSAHSSTKPFFPGSPFASSPDRKSTRLNSSHIPLSRMPSSA